MPYNIEHRAQTRAKIVDSARKLFNRHGFDQVSIEQVMAGAGLTRGGFYHHFKTKDELYAEAVASFTSCNPFSRRAVAASTTPGELARMLIALYLSDEVLDNPDLHCPLYALPGDVARAGLSPQRAYTDLIRNLALVFERALEGRADASERAHAIVALPLTAVGFIVVPCVAAPRIYNQANHPGRQITVQQYKDRIGQ